MKIQDITNTNNLYKPSFGSLNFKMHQYMDCNGKMRISQCTTAKRDDLNYDNAADIIIQKFKKYNTVKIMPMNVSDGTEAYFLAESLVRKVGFDEFKKRFTPIVASDIYAPVIHSYPNNGIVLLSDDEITPFKNDKYKLLKRTNKKLYNKYILNPSDKNKKLYKLIPEFKDCFTFMVTDFQKRLKNLKDNGNSVIIIRNCLYHSFGEKESVEIVKKVADILKPNSLFIIGAFDRNKMPNLFMETINKYFNEIETNIFQRKHNLEKFYNYPRSHYI